MVKRKLPLNEFGFMVCQAKNGKLVRGPVAHGTPDSVSIPVKCPPDTMPKVIVHTHPGGVAFPSATDIRSTRAIGLNTLCIQSDTEMRCFRLLP